MQHRSEQLPVTAASRLAHKRLHGYLQFFSVAMPAFGAILFAGYILLFLVGLFNNQQQPAFSLLLTAAGALAAVLLALPTRRMLRRDQLLPAMLLFALGFGIFFLLLNVAWQSFFLISIVGVWLPFVLLYVFLETRRQAASLAVTSGVFSGLILLATEFRPVSPTAISDPAALPAILLTLFVVLAFASIAVITNLIKFRTVAGRLTVTFVVVTLLPALTTMLILSIQSYGHDQQLIFEVMDSVATQKISQIDQAVALTKKDMDAVLSDPQAQRIFAGLLGGEASGAVQSQNLESAQNYFSALIDNSELYKEMLLLDPEGQVAFSTKPEEGSTSFDGEPFYQQALFNPYSTTVTNIPDFGDPAFVAAEPILAGGKTIGEIVFVSDYSQFAQIVGTPSGAKEEGETYLVSQDLVPLTRIQQQVETVDTLGTSRAFKGRQSGDGIYQNYLGNTVLGSYHWVPALSAALLTEQDRLQSLLPTFLLIGNIVIIGLFAIVLSIMAVVFTSRTLTTPIQELAAAAQRISEGNLSSRADANRPDEIGTLAETFNFMAATLQEIVTNLETRVDDRTRDLQRQALRLRAAAEISRDAAVATDLHELLTRSAELISERFGYYHVSIFLMDSNRESLILSAANGEPGKLMLETGYKVRRGETAVAAVAQTGSSRLTPDISRESVSARNPLLPGTRSELALPLKTDNVLIGVLDVHSDQVGAFTDEDVAGLQLMADQLSAAIEHTRILQQSENSLRELEKSYQRYTRESWQALLRAREGGMLGYRYEGADFQRLDNVPASARQALEQGEQVILEKPDGSTEGTTLAVPIRLRGTTIGAISLTVSSHEVPAETSGLARDISERLAQSLEASWLLNESRARAERERFIAEMSTKIGAAPDVENILRTAAEELGKMVGDSKITIRLKSDAGNPARN